MGSRVEGSSASSGWAGPDGIMFQRDNNPACAARSLLYVRPLYSSLMNSGPAQGAGRRNVEGPDFLVVLVVLLLLTAEMRPSPRHAVAPRPV